jgi:hypothetical protein
MQDQQPKLISKQQEKIVIVNQKEKESFAKVVFSAIGAIFRAIYYVLLFLLSSIGLTALINDEIREKILELVL